MDRPEIVERVATLIHETSGTPIEDVVPTASLADELGVDHLDRIEIALQLEQEFDVHLDDCAWQTAGDILRSIEIARAG